MLPALGLGLVCAIACAAGDASDPVKKSPFSDEQRSHWSFVPVERPSVPAVSSVDQSGASEAGELASRHPIDAFLLAKLKPAGLGFSQPAGRGDLLRRMSFDLTGLPPAPEDVDAFMADKSPDAVDRLIERLLASPNYGEKWGRHWLDLVRFAETAGFNADTPRPLAYKYRDYVIRSFNDDVPYDRFVQEQIAGDEMFPHRVDALIATGYLRMWPDESNASNILLARQDALNDLTANVSNVFLGLSLGCAQCHDHKFDPLLQDDFYELQAFFAGIIPEDAVPIATAEQLAAYRRQLDEWLAKTAELRRELHELEQTARVKASTVKRLKFPEVVLEAIDAPPEERTPYQRQLVFWSERQIDVNDQQLLEEMSEEQQQRRDELRKELEAEKRKKPKPPQTQQIMAAVEVSSDVPETSLLAGGSYDAPLWEVEPGFVRILSGGFPNAARFEPAFPGTSGRRTSLARWLTDPNNPITARVMVNRIWQEHFGTGLVQNANDFGTQTANPEHQELLDWLAGEFVRRNWSIKAMHRLILTSQAWQQATDRRTADNAPFIQQALKIDPDNRLYWHFPRRRLAAEAIRDSLLFVAGELNDGMYGPGVRPELPPDFNSREKWDVSKEQADRNRRSVYIHAKRNLPYPLLQAFDFPDMHESCACRSKTTVAPQSLMLLNSEMVVSYAKTIAARLLAEHPSGDLQPLVSAAYLQIFSREPQQQEAELAIAFIESQLKIAEKKVQSDQARLSACTDFCHALLNANEFLYVD